MTSLKHLYLMMSLNYFKITDVPVWDIENPSMGHSLQEDKCSQKKIFFLFHALMSQTGTNEKKINSFVGGRGIIK